MNFEQLDKSLVKAREVVNPMRKFEAAGKGTVVEFVAYHNSKTRHDALLLKLEDGKEVVKILKPSDWLTAVHTFNNADTIFVWYDKNNLVQQFCLSYKK